MSKIPNVGIFPKTETPGELLYVQCPECQSVYHPGFKAAPCDCDERPRTPVPWDPGLDTSPHYLHDMLIGLLDEIELAGLHVDKETGSLWSAYVDALCYLARTSTVGRYFWREK